MKTRSLWKTGGAVTVSLLAACASTKPPKELQAARTAYEAAATSPGAPLARADVYEAKKALDNAERQFADDGDEPTTRDSAYVAERKAIIARSKGNTALSNRARAQALAEVEQLKQQGAMASGAQLGQAKGDVQMDLASERQARAAADRRTQAALLNVEGVTIKNDTGGLLVTLGGGALFATGKSEPLPATKKRLDAVVTALKAERDDTRTMTIYGHTDSTGDEQKNRELSQQRADAVRGYLISQGIREDRIDAKGMGQDQPVAENTTAEGRASNRRVEIVLHGPSK